MQSMFAARGYQVHQAVLSPQACAALRASLDGMGHDSAGTRNLLLEPWCRQLARQIQGHAGISALLPRDGVAVQCTYFEKSSDRNWLVTVHQDLSVPVKTRVDHPELRNWCMKEGALFVQAPISLLEQMVAVRVHVDRCGHDDGPLRVVPGTHGMGIVDAEDAPSIRERLGEDVCIANPGDALVMRPLLLHASSKARGESRRRVLHFVFGPSRLPFGLQWPSAQ